MEDGLVSGLDTLCEYCIELFQEVMIIIFIMIVRISHIRSTSLWIGIAKALTDRSESASLSITHFIAHTVV